ncbi:MAG: AAA family ATPase [Desulfobacteraceae bacterium]|nr:AAA family ATPase [Desulfobacteraceae bacterium]
MDAIRIENLRSLSDTGFVELKPLTLLVGQNSSGKSSFLRFFPLLRQSIEARTAGPISWYGNLIDFGSFQEAVSRKSENREIKFQFRLTLNKSKLDIRTIRIERGLSILEDLTLLLTINVKEDRTQESSRTAGCLISFADHEIKIEFENHGKVNLFKINNFDVLDIGKHDYVGLEGRFLPRIYAYENTADALWASESINKILSSEVGKLVRHFIGEKTIISTAQFFHIGSSEVMLESMKTAYANETWKRNASSWTIHDKQFQLLRDLVIAKATIELLPQLDTYLNKFASGIRYIAPVRATAERYYRPQNLALDEVDSRGQNLAMFVKNLTASERKSFENWIREHFGFILRAISSGGHIALHIKELAEGEEFNLADTGFGYSQILPVLMQLWFMITKKHFQEKIMLLRKIPSVFAIEQPELHLHPGLQAKLADVFITAIKLAKKNNIDLKLIIETHSEIIVNRMGHRIANEDLNPEDINVVLFEKEPSVFSTKVSFSGYDKDGFLTNWPFGFLEPDMI